MRRLLADCVSGVSCQVGAGGVVTFVAAFMAVLSVLTTLLALAVGHAGAVVVDGGGGAVLSIVLVFLVLFAVWVVSVLV